MTFLSIRALRLRDWLLENKRELLVALALAIVCAIAIEIGKGGWHGPETYKIYLVGDQGNPEINAVYKPFLDLAAHIRLEINGVPVEVKVKNDLGSPKTAVEIAKELRDQPDTLLIIGSVRTQETKEALPYYMDAIPQIPVITTTESDDDLLGSCLDCDEQEYVPLLQLSPTNRIQAESAIRYAKERGRKRFLLVSEENSQNPSYSTNLVSDFRTAIQTYAGQGLILVGEVHMGQPPTLESLKLAKPDCVLYAGESGTAHALADALADYRKDPGVHAEMTLILSDASVMPGLKDDSMNEFKSVFYTFASDAAFYRRNVNVFGEDAFAIVSQLLATDDGTSEDLMERLRKFVGMRRVGDARKDIIRRMKRNILVGSAYTGESGERYQFVGYQRQGALFHVWSVEDGKVADVDGWHAQRTE